MGVEKVRGTLTAGSVHVTGAGIKGAKQTATATAPGVGQATLRWETGTNAGTLKLVAYAGTSATGTTVIDNVGAGN